MAIQDIFTIQMSFAHKKLSKAQRKIVEERNFAFEAGTVCWNVARRIGYAAQRIQPEARKFPEQPPIAQKKHEFAR